MIKPGLVEEKANELWGRGPRNSYCAERVGKAVTPLLLAAANEATTLEEMRAVMRETIALLGMVVGSAADGSRSASESSAYFSDRLRNL